MLDRRNWQRLSDLHVETANLPESLSRKIGQNVKARDQRSLNVEKSTRAIIVHAVFS